MVRFEHRIIDPETPWTHNSVCLIADIDGDGCNDVLIGAFKGEGNIVWYEYPDWKRHTIGTGTLEAGGIVLDINGNGRLDFVAGCLQGPDLYWFENSGDPEKEWTRRVICSDFFNYHNQAFGDIDGDGEREIVIPSQGRGKGNGNLFYYDIPADPTVSPWPAERRHFIWRGLVLEGVAVADVDGDGEMEVVAGSHWFKRRGEARGGAEKPGGPEAAGGAAAPFGWECRVVDESYRLLCVAVGDIDGDGRPEIVMSEGESHPARLAWFGNAPRFDQEHVLADDLFHPHSLALADFTGSGRLDIFVAEMGLTNHPGKPKLMIYENLGGGRFERHVISRGIPTHSAQVGDIGRTGRPSIVGKPWFPEHHVDLWLNLG